MSKIEFSIGDNVDWDAVVPPVAWAAGFGQQDARNAGDRVHLRALRREELAIARAFHQAARWPYAAIALGSFILWLALFPLTIYHWVNPFVACVVAALTGIVGFITGHEAMHGNLHGRDGKAGWLNELIGWTSLVLIVIPLSVARITHLAHHAHCNDPELDPDYCDDAPNRWAALVKTWYNRQPGVQGVNFHYRRILREAGTPASAAAIRHAGLYHIGFMATLFAFSWSGHAITAAMVWWLPRQLALSYIRFTISWLPHHPRHERQGRYGNTRVFRSPFGTLLTAAMPYHIIHHLYPNIVIHKNKPAFYAMRHVLEARGVDCSALPPRNGHPGGAVASAPAISGAGNPTR